MSYSGGKAGSGVYQKVINLMPPHGTYIEAFLGAGAIMNAKRPAAFNVGIEISRDVQKMWSRCDIPNFRLESDAIKYLSDLCTEIDLMKSRFPDFGRDYLVYCDPPYLMEVRSHKRPIYKHEFHTAKEHTELLQILRRLPCYVMISGYDSELYNRLLHDWRKVQFAGVSRGGPRTETVWLNFPEPAELHDYRFLGDDRRERQDIKRQKMRWLAKLDKMPSQRRYAMFSALEEYRSAVGRNDGTTKANGRADAVRAAGTGPRSDDGETAAGRENSSQPKENSIHV